MTDTFLRESTKFRVSPAPIQVPGTCASCGSSSTEDRDYVDFGLFVEYVGVIYFCTFCFDECANALGYISPKQSRELENLLNEAQQRIIEFRIKEKALDDAINLLRNSGLLAAVAESVSTSDEILIPAVDEGSVSDNSGVNEGQSDIDKQTSKQGPSKFSADGSDVDFLSL